MTSKTLLAAMEPIVQGTVYDYSDEELLRRAVKSARRRDHQKGFKHPRWSAVADAFALGSTYSMQLCARFDLDPHEMVKR
jgi:hypothetical protein